MEQREHPRIQIPLLVEVTHPAIGTVQTTARDISAGGLFVTLSDAKLKVGGKLKLRLLTVLPTDTQPTPTVEMEVKRVADEGLGVMFVNRTAQHLWSSVQQIRHELQIGRDYFQIHQSLAVTHADKGVLLVQQNGKWLLPGHYLIVGQSSTNALRDYAESVLGVSLSGKFAPSSVVTNSDTIITEAATYSVIFTTSVDDHAMTLAPDCGYTDWRWIAKLRDLGEITFVSDAQRLHAEYILNQESEAQRAS
jgi:hypothetical protein